MTDPPRSDISLGRFLGQMLLIAGAVALFLTVFFIGMFAPVVWVVAAVFVVAVIAVVLAVRATLYR